MAIRPRERFEVLRRFDFACFYCGASAPEVELQVDHVLPRAHGGTDDPWNLVSACRPCNIAKFDSLPTLEMIERAMCQYQATVLAFDPHYRVVLCTICKHPVQEEIDNDPAFPPQCSPCNEAICDAFDAGVRCERRLRAAS